MAPSALLGMEPPPKQEDLKHRIPKHTFHLIQATDKYSCQQHSLENLKIKNKF